MSLGIVSFELAILLKYSRLTSSLGIYAPLHASSARYVWNWDWPTSGSTTIIGCSHAGNSIRCSIMYKHNHNLRDAEKLLGFLGEQAVKVV
jgi:hypothetical protein